MVDIHVRGIPKDVHANLREIAAAEGITLDRLTASALTLLGTYGAVVTSARPGVDDWVTPGDAVVASGGLITEMGRVIRLPDAIRQRRETRLANVDRFLRDEIRALREQREHVKALRDRVHPDASPTRPTGRQRGGGK
jgi:hypothetical protein